MVNDRSLRSRPSRRRSLDRARGRSLPIAVLLALAVGRCATDASNLIVRIESAPVSDRERILRAAIAEQGGTPVVEGEEAHFLFERAVGPAPRLVSDFNGWGQIVDATMTRLEGTSWYYLTQTLPPGARIEYAIALSPIDDGNLVLDPENPNTVESLSRLYSELRMPGYVDPPELVEDPGPSRGTVVETEFESRIRENRRKIFIYLPHGYDEAKGQRYPTAYFGDGSTYISSPPVPRILDFAIARGILPPLIAVFVEPMPRSEEYRMNEEYRRFVVEELVPFVDETYRTLAGPSSRAIVGSSSGGLAAIDLAWFHPDVFGACGALAPAPSLSQALDRIRGGEARSVRFFVLVGLYDLRWRSEGIELRDVLLAKGYGVEFLEIPEGHSSNAWSPYIDDALASLLPVSTAYRKPGTLP